MKSNHQPIIIIILTTLALLGVAILFLGQQTTENLEPVKADQAALVSNTAAVKGEQTAMVTIVEYSDFQCPACAYASSMLKQVKEQYKDQIKVVFRHFPLNFHQHAMDAALAAEAAGRQDKFWEMHDLLFARQTEWSELSNEELSEVFGSYAQELGLDRDQFNLDMHDENLANKIDQDVKDGYKLNINATPTLFVNGIKVEGAGPQFTEVLQAELGK